jgi:hypothetical protein
VDLSEEERMPAATLAPKAYYRLPWNYSDNAVSWLEPTTKCNLACEGCYRNTEAGKNKSLDEVQSDLDVFASLRKSDCISIAGGDPLMHHQIADIVRTVKARGWKPIVNTNGVALTPQNLKALKGAGAFGFTFHIDTTQVRPRCTAKTETELNAERLKYAHMLAREGNLACAFNSTVSEKTLREVPNLVHWARDHADCVHTMVFILFRSPELSGEFDYFAGGKPIVFGQTYKETSWGGERKVKTSDMVETLRTVDPTYRPSAYLNGTANPHSTKWLLATRLILNGRVLGYVSPKFQEISQVFHHLFTGRYLSYVSPKTLRKGKLWTLLSSLLDKDMRKLARRLIWEHIKNPLNFFRRATLQSLMVIQPIDINADGRQDMCDGCPDVTVHKGRLVWSCRLEELNEYGHFVQSYPKQSCAQ